MSDKNPEEADDFLDEFDRALKDFFDDSAQVERLEENAAGLRKSVDPQFRDFFGEFEDKDDLIDGGTEDAASPPVAVPEVEETLLTEAADAPVVSPPDTAVAVAITEMPAAEAAMEDKRPHAAAMPQESGAVSSPALTAADAPAEEPAEETTLPAETPETPPTGVEADAQAINEDAEMSFTDAAQESTIGVSDGPDTLVPAPSQPEKKRGRRRIALWGAAAVFVVAIAAYLATTAPEKEAGDSAETSRISHKVSPRPAPVTTRTAPAVKETPPPAATHPAPAVQEAPPPITPSPVTAPPEAAAPIVATAPPETAAAPAAAAAPPAATVEAYPSGAYPYAIHLSSFKSYESAAKEAATEMDRGLRVYPVRIDLGKKGIWYRLYYGYFKSAESATAAITKDRLTGAVVRNTRYACLVGSYPLAAEARAASQQLTGKGFVPYTIDIGGAHHVFVGAYRTLKAAQARSQDLSSSGFANAVIQR